MKNIFSTAIWIRKYDSPFPESYETRKRKSVCNFFQGHTKRFSAKDLDGFITVNMINAENKKLSSKSISDFALTLDKQANYDGEIDLYQEAMDNIEFPLNYYAVGRDPDNVKDRRFRFYTDKLFRMHLKGVRYHE